MQRAAVGVPRGPLTPGELAEAAVLGDLALVLEVIGWFAPTGFGTFLHGLAIVPFAMLASRHRVRAALVSAVAAASVGFLVGGLGIVVQTMLAGLLGISIGVGHRRGWKSLRATAFTAALAGVPLALLTEITYFASPGLRKLTFAQIRISWRAALAALRDLRFAGVASTLSRRGNPVLAWVFAHWWVALPALEIAGVVLVGAFCLRMRPFLSEVSRHSIRPMTATVADAGVPEDVPAPVPVSLVAASYRYEGAERDALRDVTLEVAPGRLVVVTGQNGSGKSTLVRILAGRLEPTSGALRRAGAAGLGRIGGTAMVFQRPESQVLGVRVRDDLCWGLGQSQLPDIERLLDRVGLSGFGERETATLSGGELQRLALAAALARSPRLLISDESTAMVDREGRETIVQLLRELATGGLAVVHVTHRVEEEQVADDVVVLSGGRLAGSIGADESRGAPRNGAAPLSQVVPVVRPSSSRLPPHLSGPPSGPSGPQLSPKPRIRTLRAPLPVRADSRLGAPPPDLPVGAPTPPPDLPVGAPTGPAVRASEPLVRLRDVVYVYAARTPWAREALSGVTLEIWRGEGVVVTGPNGSGKSTLAWLLAGLTAPTSGDALIGDASIYEQPGRTSIAFQHARLQLLRPTVLADVALGSDEQTARRALSDVGLDPDEFGPRRVDELSGGEQRRVALAGLLVGEPDLIVLDEPYAGLDDEARRVLAGVLARLRRSRGVAVVVVSHDLDNAELLGDRMIRLESGRVAAAAALEVPA